MKLLLLIRGNHVIQAAWGQASDYLSLTKPRLVLLVVATTLAGFYLGAQAALDWPLLLHTLWGTALAAGGAVALNQFLERDLDAKMSRTAARPLPAGRLDPVEALLFGLGLAIGGTVYLLVFVNLLSSLITAVIIGCYLFLYTPLKRITTLCSIVGAVPGALPPVVGWAAATGSLGIEALILFFILFFWQIPHSLAIAYVCRRDYSRVGIQLLPVLNPDGPSTGHQIVSNCLALMAVGLLPTLIGLAGPAYFFAALLLGGGMLAYGVRFALWRSAATARGLLRASYIYVPLQLGVMALDKVAV